jgi:hypothetical protein
MTRATCSTLMAAVFLLAAWGFSFLYLYRDAVHGYQQILPVYLFAGFGLGCAVLWPYLISKAVSNIIKGDAGPKSDRLV